MLHIDLVAVEPADDVAVLLELTAPVTRAPSRVRHTVQVVLDRSAEAVGLVAFDRRHSPSAAQARQARGGRPSLAPRPSSGADVMPEAAAATMALMDEVAVIHELADLGASGDARVAAEALRAVQALRQFRRGDEPSHADSGRRR